MRRAGFTLIELIVVIVSIAILTALMLPALRRQRLESQRSSCANNLGNIIKTCHLYSDCWTPSWGVFPMYVSAKDSCSEDGDGHTQNGQLAMSQLYGAFVKDHRVFSCPSNPTDTSLVKPYVPPIPPEKTEYTQYGYDPGHGPTHATAGVVGDMGCLDSETGNSRNHEAWQPGQNVAVGAGAVEWWDDARRRSTKDANGSATTDDIFSDNWHPNTFPEEIETWIIE